jgi:phosphatidylglycerophosphate synthase
MSPNATPRYHETVKSDISDEPLNTYLLRPVAHQFVRIFYHTSITPNQVTGASLLAGAAAALVYAFGGDAFIPAGGLLVTLKDLLDTADGQLARARSAFSRFGRFLDSVGDFAVNLLLFAAISYALYLHTGWLPVFAAGAAGFLGISLRVSYHVFYQTSFLHLGGMYTGNRITEEVREEDRTSDRRTLRLQQLFQLLYGWQDRLMTRLDAWSGRGIPADRRHLWYADRTALLLSGFLGLGTELFTMMFFSLFRRLDLYLAFNLIAANLVWGICIAYRRLILNRRLRAMD